MPTEAPPARVTGQTHLYWLDWLRFLAALLVLVDHTRGLNWDRLLSYHGGEGSPARAVFISLTSLGRQAVVVFFVLSGWLVGGNAAARVRAGTFDVAAYAADRLSRVYVPLVPALLFTLAVVRSFDGYARPMSYVICLVGLQDVSGIPKPEANPPLWSLGFEIWYYILAGGAAAACQRGGAWWVRFTGLAVAALAARVCYAQGWTYLMCWLFGVAGGWLRDRLAPGVRPWTVLAGVLTMAAGALVYQVKARILPPPNDAFELPNDLPMADLAQLTVAVGAVLFAASLSAMVPRSRAGRWIERAGSWAAAASYTLYLVHNPVLDALRILFGPVPAVINPSSLLRAFGWISVCIAVALGNYALFERQTPRVRRWLRTRFAGHAPGGQPAAADRPPLPAGA